MCGMIVVPMVTWGTLGDAESISYSSITELTIETGTGTNSVDVESTSDAGITITAQGGTDTYEIQLGALAGTVSVNNVTADATY